MMTPTHMLVAAGVTTRKRMGPGLVALAFFAGFFPDLPMLVMVIWARWTGFTGNMWRAPDGLYWSVPWQTAISATHSFPIWAAVFAVGLYLYFRDRGSKWALALMVLGAGAFVHAVFDFPVHTTDAHAHFWPFSDWRFISGVSYYEPQHYGNIVSKVEIVIGAAMTVLIFRRFRSWWVRGFSLFLCLPYVLELIPREWLFRAHQFLF